MQNLELNFNKKELNDVIVKNNENFIKNGGKIFSFEKTDGTITYSKQTWTFRKSTNNSTGVTSYSLELPLIANHGKGRSILVKVRLTQEMADYIINKSVKDLYNGDKLNFKTRFVYGFMKSGLPYCSVVIAFGSHVHPTLLGRFQNEIFFEKMSKLETAYDIYCEEKLVSEQISYDIDGEELETTEMIQDLD